MRLYVRRFSLRGLLLAISFGCVVLAYYVNVVAPQRAAIRALRAADGIALYASQVDSRGRPIPHAKPWNPFLGLLEVDWFNRVVYVSRHIDDECHPPRYSSDIARCAGRFPKLRVAVLFHTEISNIDLQHFAGLDDLHTLLLNRTDLDAGALDGLRGLSLTMLAMDDTRINDEAAWSISHIASLEYVSISGTDVSDTGLRYLELLPNLQKLFIQRTLITEDAYRASQQIGRAYV